MAKKLTIKDLFDLKGKRQLTEVMPGNEEECRACEAAGIDMLVVEEDVEMVRRGAPNTFLTVGAMTPEEACSDAGAIREGIDRMTRGADAVYTGQSLDRVRGRGAAQPGGRVRGLEKERRRGAHHGRGPTGLAFRHDDVGFDPARSVDGRSADAVIPVGTPHRDRVVAMSQ